MSKLPYINTGLLRRKDRLAMTYRAATAKIVAFAFIILFSNITLAAELKPGEFLTLCYHCVTFKPAASPTDTHSLTQKQFVEQMEYLRAHGYHPVSLEDILQASEGKKTLPEKPVLLSFDDAYISYYNFVVPLLERYEYPSIVGVVGSFIENPPPNLPEPLMSWEQIKEVSGKKYVEAVSHTYDLHKGIKYNPQGNEGPAVKVASYDSLTKTYETENQYRERIAADFKAQNDLFESKLGIRPRGVIWPYGKFTNIALEEAKKAGCRITLSLEEGPADVNNLIEGKRLLIQNKPIANFIKQLDNFGRDLGGIRAAQVDLDLIYNESEKETEENLGKLIERLVKMKVNTVFLQAFADPEGDGNIKSVYFQNRLLPIRANLFSHAVHQMYIRDIKVYAWMPVLSIEFPDKEFNDKYRVLEYDEGNIRPSSSWYRRLTPFSDEVGERVGMLYEDMLKSCQIQGILFQDDAYLNDLEDFHPLALEAYFKHFGQKLEPSEIEKDERLANKWYWFKTQALIDFINPLMAAAKSRIPEIVFARNMYAPVLLDKSQKEEFSQNYAMFLETYDYTVIMAYPQMEEALSPLPWLENVAAEVKKHPEGLRKTIFKVQAYDWKDKEWVDDDLIYEELRAVLAAGGRHIGYYPDNLWEDKPAAEIIRLEMSNKVYPY